MRLWRFLLTPTTETSGTTTTETATTQTAAKGADLSKAAEGLVAKHGDPTAALLVLLGENYSLRDKNRDLGAKVPGEGAVILTGDDAKHWGSYRALGTPNDLKKSIDEGKQHAADLGTYRKADVTRSAAEAHGFSPKVLGTLTEKLDIEMGQLKDDKGVLLGKDNKALPKDGIPVPVAYVKGEGDERTALDKYAASHWGEFMPSLKPSTETPKPNGTPNAFKGRTFQPAAQGGGEAPKRVRSGF